MHGALNFSLYHSAKAPLIYNKYTCIVVVAGDGGASCPFLLAGSRAAPLHWVEAAAAAVP